MPNQFSDLGIQKELQSRMRDIEIIEPTEVQKKVIPFILERKKDLVALAKTGTGKTAAFSLPIIQMLDISFKITQKLMMLVNNGLENTHLHLLSNQKILKAIYSP